ncbi:cytochrome b5 domain-containing protein [Companilactobacillus versmoldensis]|uniref:Cytochrome b5 n=1 Tax=Companilactobacillus versmoldensis DSM 14857 = KCTC 3814 TaxID=1423815 RepID=A0A0R1SCU7_9LACO|nr:cytochrome b5 domain-containing protein [Companilactobacillus versmoldensis]KRL66828.1 cytochrome b5 [Companilactobacillus versmoldensis DSM 14857 = KCTC 3814]
MSEKNLTLDELKKYNGQDGNPAYVAVDGVIYDVTNVEPWAGGKHHGHTAGGDMSEEITHAPHKKTVLPKLPVVGKLVK